MALCFYVRIGARGDADTRLGARSYLAHSNPKNFLTFQKAEGGAGGSRQKVERKFLGVASQWHTSSVYHTIGNMNIAFPDTYLYYEKVVTQQRV